MMDFWTGFIPVWVVCRGAGAHLLGMTTPERDLRLRVTRRAEPDVARLVELVLNIAEVRYQAHVNGEPDPYGLSPPDQLTAHRPATPAAPTGSDPEGVRGTVE